ncbi:hypothetical protein [Ensifer canadensis]
MIAGLHPIVCGEIGLLDACLWHGELAHGQVELETLQLEPAFQEGDRGSPVDRGNARTAAADEGKRYVTHMNAPEKIRFDRSCLATTLDKKSVGRPCEHELAGGCPRHRERDYRHSGPKRLATATASSNFCLRHDFCPFTKQDCQRFLACRD